MKKCCFLWNRVRYAQRKCAKKRGRRGKKDEKQVAGLLCLIAVCLTLTACSGPREEEEKTSIRIGVSLYRGDDTFINNIRNELEAKAKEYEQEKGIKVTLDIQDARGSQSTQNNQVERFISLGCDVLCINPVDRMDASVIIDKAMTAEVPVVFFNRQPVEEDMNRWDKLYYIGVDAKETAMLQGQMVVDLYREQPSVIDLNGDGVISYVMFKGQEGNAEADARTQYGVEDANAVLTAAGKEELSFYDSSNSNKYLVDQAGAWSAAAATEYMQTAMSQYSEANNNMIELVIANNDEMAIGSVTALQNAGYNKEGATVIPVFGVDATDAAKDAIAAGSMIGTIKQDAEGMANTIAQIAQNFQGGADKFADVDAANVVGTWRVNIPYATYTGE